MPPEAQLAPDLAAALERLDELVAAFETHPDPAVQAAASEMLRCVDATHRAGLGRLVELVRDAGMERRLVEEPAVRLLVDLYDLAEGGEQGRADAVLDSVRPYVESHGGRLEVVAARDGVVTVRLSGACHGCSGSAATLRHVVEGTLRDAMPGFVRMEVVAPPAPSNFIPLTAIQERPRLRWHETIGADEVPPDGVRGLEVEGERVLVASVAGELYAYRNACPGTPFPLDAGLVEDGALICPFHGCRFDLRGGRRLDAPGPGLGVVPVAVEAGRVRIGVLSSAA
jgi:nitrite reductase/ring-hydroxylating ferredoxin subunit/Fe-S cluster biogenesis protein NfuA